MPTTLTYGLHTVCQLDDIEATIVRPHPADSIPAESIANIVQTQLAEPLEFPPLAQSTIPDDLVVIAIEPGVPQLAHVIDGVLRSLELAGSETANITILLADPSNQPDTLQSQLASLGHSHYRICRHDPADEKEIAFLGVSQSSLPMRLNRQLCDADLVLPIGVSSFDQQATDGHALPSNLYPAFSDTETIERLSASTAEQFPAIVGEAAQEISDCYRQLGMQMSLRVVPGTSGQLTSVVAGEIVAASHKANSQHSELWQPSIPHDAKLVVATITGENHQTWDSVGRAIAAADSMLESEGAIVICTELSDLPGRALQQLAGNEDPLLVEREILRTPSSDCGSALVLCRTLQQHTVYLRSRLKPSLVESLGIMPLESDQEIERLAHTHRPCTVLEEAQWMQPIQAEQDEDEDE